MNWETYKSMTDEQKEEYNFKYKDKQPTINGKGMVRWTSFMILILTQFMMTIYLAITHEAFASLKEQVTILLVAVMRIVHVMGIAIGVFLLGYAINIIWHLFTEWKWLKDNNIKKVKAESIFKKFKKWRLKKNEQKNVSVR